MLCYNFTLPEVCNYLPPNILSWVFVAKEKHTSVYFDREKLQFMGLDDACMKQMKEAYPGVNIASEIKKMQLWLTSPKGRDRKGTISFIMNWLGNCPASSSAPEIEQDTPLRPLLDTYLRDLWKGKEHLLEMNKRRS